MSQNLKPARVTKPGRILSRELKARGWTQKDLAEIMSRPVQTINEIIQGNKQITPETAIELSQALGTSAEFWTNLETKYRLHLAQKNQIIFATLFAAMAEMSKCNKNCHEFSDLLQFLCRSHLPCIRY